MKNVIVGANILGGTLTLALKNIIANDGSLLDELVVHDRRGESG